MGLIPWPDGDLELPVPGTSLFLLDAGGEDDGRRRRELGRGGQGIVFAARDDDEPLQGLAVKFPLLREWEDEQALDALRMEIRRSTRIGTTPYLARTFEPLDLRAYPAWPPLGLVMEFFPINLSQLVTLCERHCYQFSAKQVAEWARHLTEGLRELHDRHKFVHRDIKPSNIMFRPLAMVIFPEDPRSLIGSEAVVTDFGTVARCGEVSNRVVCRKDKDRFKHPDFYPLHDSGKRPPPQLCVPEMDINAFGEVLHVLRRLCAGGET